MERERFVLLEGDCLETLKSLADNSVDSVATDPPYEIGFMGKAWDGSGIAYNVQLWRECLRVLKPGGHLLAFGATRSYHRMAVAIEDAGFEIRDSIHWTYGSGFPKSHNVGKVLDKQAGAVREVVGKASDGIASGTGKHAGMDNAYNFRADFSITAPATPEAKRWEGWGTALKPSHEPIVVARKPLAGTVAENVLEYGTGAINVDGCRVGSERRVNGVNGASAGGARITQLAPGVGGGEVIGRWPANTILTHSAACVQTGTATVKSDAHWADTKTTGYGEFGGGTSVYSGPGHQPKQETVAAFQCVPGCPVAALDGQSGQDASRFFQQTVWDPEWDVPFKYVPKPSRKERNAGLGGLPEKRKVFNGKSDKPAGRAPGSVEDKFTTAPATNNHPTVKPVALMRYLVRLLTPPGGTVLDPFLGSGTTAVASILEGYNVIGCELTPDYVPIIQARVAHAQQTVDSALFPE